MTDILSKYEPITLAEMKGIRLMNRTDTKFVTTTERLKELLLMARMAYRAQEIDGRRIARYYTVYFDTDECDMFHVHQCGVLNRQKLRIRSYVDSGLNFLEVKTKNNHKRTKKQRVTVEGFSPLAPRYDMIFDNDGIDEMEDANGYVDFINSHLRYDADSLAPQIENRFNRITLVNNNKTERLTIDTDLRFHNLSTGRDMSFDGIAVIELKRDGQVYSPILDMLLDLRIKPMGFSKYCMGAAFTNDTLRCNRFIPRMHTVGKLMQEAHRCRGEI
ncbi:MAG: polyphosphate polymerase domain-containing protein [Prevotella sp.]